MIYVKKGGKPVRLRLFDKLESDLRKNVIGKSGVILCPMCLKEFGRGAAEHLKSIPQDAWLTEEHVIPESTGNQEVTLTCRPCNNTLGHQIDSHLARKVRLDRAAKLGERVKGTLFWPDGGAPVDMEQRPDGQIHLHLKPTTSRMAQQFLERARKYESGERQLSLTIDNRLDMKKFVASVAKAAYLGMFVDRGYAYILLPALEAIRRAIMKDGPDRERLFEVIVPCGPMEVTDLPGVPDRFTFEMHALGGVPVCLSLVNMRNASESAWMVMPPGTNVNTGGWDGLVRAAEAFRGKPMQIELDPDGTVRLFGI
jgi:hypothetical protein